MAGHLNGVQAKIQHEEPRAHNVHCTAHALNLCLQENAALRHGYPLEYMSPVE